MKERGFNLVELCVSSALMTLLLSMLFQQYLQLKQHHDAMQSALDEAFEVQYASDLIRHHIQQAGFTPCGMLLDISPLTISKNEMTIRRMGLPFTKAMVKTHGHDVLLQTALSLKPGDVMLMTDCMHAEKHVIQTKLGNRLQLRDEIHQLHSGTIYIGPWIEERFLISSKALSYHRLHTEVLTHSVISLEAILQGKNNVDVIMTRRSGEKQLISVRMRMA